MSSIQDLIDKYQHDIDNYTKLQKLLTYPEFKDLIMQNYLVDECAECVHLSTNGNLPEQVREHALFQAQSAGAFKNYLESLKNKYEYAVSAIEEAKQSQLED